MRDFETIARELGLVRLIDSIRGDLYYVPVTSPAPEQLVRRFNREIPSALIPAFVRLTAAAQRWIARDPELAALVSVDQPLEVGSDFIARPHRLGTSLMAYGGDEDPPEPADELAPMQARFRALAARPIGDERERLLVEVLGRSLLEPTSKTLYSEPDEGFVIAELRPTRDELERWAALDA